MKEIIGWILFGFGLGVLLITNPNLARADEQGKWWVVSTVTSYHVERDRGYNESNLGLGVEYGLSSSFRAVLGTYKNSYFRQSNYVGISWYASDKYTWNIGGHSTLKPAATVIAVSGYDHGGNVIPFPMIEYHHKGTGLGANLLLSPAVFALQLKMRLP